MERRSFATAISGARSGVLDWPRRLLAWAVAHDLTAFVVPDARLARAAGLDPEAAGLCLAATPRHATALLVVESLPDGLAAAASVAYAQMPRPRAILAVGVSSIAGLPEPDVVTPLGQDALLTGVAELRRRLAVAAFSPEAAALEIAAARTRIEYVCPMHPEVVRNEPGICPICGMDLVARESAGAMPEPAQSHAGMGIHGAMTAAPPPQDANVIYTCPMHPQIAQAEPGRCPICGMHLVPATETQEQAIPEHAPASAADHGEHAGHGAHAGHDAMASEHAASRGAMGHGGHGQYAAAPRRDAAPADHGQQNAPMAAGHAAMGHDSGERDDSHETMEHGTADHSEMNHAAMDHASMDHGGTDHSMNGGGFMSMVAMTRDLPRSADGLPMEWAEVPFGPIFPGLPGGLDVIFTLDGDGVARAVAGAAAAARGLKATWPGPGATFPDRLARLDPLAPVAYRLLARRALEAVAGVEIDEAVAQARVRAAEWERVGSHLGWLAQFGSLLGDEWLAERAAQLQVTTATSEPFPRLVQEIRGFVGPVSRAPMLGRRLAGIGETGKVERGLLRGPVARAAGIERDARVGDPWYASFGFTPVERSAGDALARLQVRIAEIAASLDLVLEAVGGVVTQVDPALPAHLSGTAEAAIETPRGAARLRLEVEHGSVVDAVVDPPSAALIRLVPGITEGAEVADALAAVASLDLSPWEVDP